MNSIGGAYSMLKRNSPQSGAVLIVVLMVLIIMSLIVMQFAFSMSLNRMIAVNMTESPRLAYLAYGGVEYTKNLLRVDRQQNEIDTLHEAWANPKPPFDPTSNVKVTVQDECGKINVNSLVLGSAVNIPLKEALERLFLAMDINIEAVHRLVDYIDPDMEGDFEDGAKNAPLDNLTELMNIEYITPEVFFTLSRPEDAQDDDEEKQLGLVDLLTTLGPGQVNINTAPEQVIRALFGKAKEELGAFNDYREKNAFESLNELLPLGFTNVDSVSSVTSFSSEYFRIISRAKSERITKTVECVLIRGTRKIRVLEQRVY